MSGRELVVLGTASQVPTRERSHHGCLLRWDDRVLLLDPGEGTQRQLLLAGVPVSAITDICLTHFHGDHCLGLPGVLQRRSLDASARPVDVWFPAEGAVYFERLRHATAYHERSEVRPHPVPATGGSPEVVADGGGSRLLAQSLDHRVPTLGWRLEEPDGRRMLPDRLAARGVAGPDVGVLLRDGRVEVEGRAVALAEVSEPRRGQVFSFVMDTRRCDAALSLAAGADLLVCEATYLDRDAALADEHAHLTAHQAATIAREAGARRLVLTHFSQRYPELDEHLAEARAVVDDVVVARDLERVPVPRRR